MSVASRGYIKPPTRQLLNRDIINNNHGDYDISLFWLTKKYNECNGQFEHGAILCSEILNHACLIDYGIANESIDRNVIEAAECFKFLVERGHPYNYKVEPTEGAMNPDIKIYHDLCTVVYIARYRMHLKEIREFVAYYFALFPEINDDERAKMIIARSIISTVARVNINEFDEYDADVMLDPDVFVDNILEILREFGINLDGIYYEALNLTIAKSDGRIVKEDINYYVTCLESGIKAGVVINNKELEYIKYGHYKLRNTPNCNIVKVIVKFIDFLYQFMINKDDDHLDENIQRLTIALSCEPHIGLLARNDMINAVRNETAGTVERWGNDTVPAVFLRCIRRILSDNETFYLKNDAVECEQNTQATMDDARCLINKLPKSPIKSVTKEKIAKLAREAITIHVLPLKFALFTSKYINNRYVWKALHLKHFTNAPDLEKIEANHNKLIDLVINKIVDQGIDKNKLAGIIDDNGKWNNLAHLTKMLAEF